MCHSFFGGYSGMLRRATFIPFILKDIFVTYYQRFHSIQGEWVLEIPIDGYLLYQSLVYLKNAYINLYVVK